ncbi:MAG: alpha-N-acetylglucosaminidase C-terminal domain-containing protein, partial [Planctomycetes bacterium]|nr:alpha-N-acetylglucosaminidase C-terminal domain-containing protein [Planctomycetota bacterium]
MPGIQTAILIGQARTNPLIAGLVGQGTVKLSASYPGLDGFIVRAIGLPAGLPFSHAVILGGSRDRGSLYAVYHFLGSVLGVGFFWDGNYIPKEATVSTALNCAERPWFPIRQLFQNCDFGYSTPAWGFGRWRRELDWAAAMRFNRVILPLYLTDGVVTKLAWKRLGYGTGKLTQRQRYDLALNQRIIHYARQRLGMKVILDAYGGQVPAGFRAKHPKARYLGPNLSPTAPLFTKVGKVWLDEEIHLFGTDHIYNTDPYAEHKPLATLSFASGVMHCLLAADPKAVWYASGWAWRYYPYWSVRTVHRFLERLPEGRFYVCDIYADSSAIYRHYHYFWGRMWGVGVLHSFGGNGSLFGNAADLVRRMKRVVADPKARNCRAFYLNPELINYNTFYFDLAARLGWNPKTVHLSEDIADYAVRRYGRVGAVGLLPFLEAVAKSVYGRTGGCNGFYLRKMYDFPTRDVQEMVSLRDTAKRLDGALRIGLTAERLEKGNPLYIRDMVDVSRQDLAEAFNLYTYAVYNAYRRRDRRSFTADATILHRALGTLQNLLSSYRPYRIRHVARRVVAQPGGEAAWPGIENELYTFAAGGPLDYQAKDFYELVKFYDCPRVEAWLRAMREDKLNGKPLSSSPQLHKAYKAIEQGWVRLNVGALPPARPHETALQCAGDAVRLVERLTRPPVVALLADGKAPTDAAALSQFRHSYIAGRPSRIPRPGRSWKVIPNFNVDPARWHSWEGNPNLDVAAATHLNNFSVDGAAVVRRNISLSTFLTRGDTFDVEFFGRFVADHGPYDNCQFSIYSAETREGINLYYQGGGPYATINATSDGNLKSTLVAVGGGQGWHLYRIEKTPTAVIFYVDGKKVAS